MPRLLTTLCLILTVASFATASSLEQLQASFMSRYDEANAERDQNLKKLEASYLGALQRHMDKVKASGKLERVIPVRDEIEAIETGADPLPELPERADSNLKKMRQQYLDARGKVRKSHAETLVSLSDTMDQALQKEEADLTRAGKIDEALSAKRMRDTLSNDPGLAGARNLLADTGDSGGVPLGGWRNLLDEKMEVLEGRPGSSRKFSSLGVDDRAPAPYVAVLENRKESPETILMAYAPTKFEFRLAEPATLLRGVAYLGHSNGNVVARVYVDGEVSFEKTLDKAGDMEVDIQFKPTRKIILEMDSGDKTDHDWTAWIKPEVR